jgi:hypothetical protein
LKRVSIAICTRKSGISLAGKEHDFGFLVQYRSMYLMRKTPQSLLI